MEIAKEILFDNTYTKILFVEREEGSSTRGYRRHGSYNAISAGPFD